MQSESWLWRERERLEEDKAELQEHRENIERERKMVIEAAKKLDREASTLATDRLSTDC